MLAKEFLFAFYYRFYQPHKEDVVIDVGANIGDFCIPLSKLVAKVYAFEPVSEAFLSLKNIMANDGRNIVPINLACLDNNGCGIIFRDMRSSGGSRISDSTGGELVKVVRLEEVLTEDTVGLLKVDVEDLAHRVLVGCSSLLPKVRKVIVEIHTCEEQDKSSEILHNYGFRVRLYRHPHGFPIFMIGDNKIEE